MVDLEAGVEAQLLGRLELGRGGAALLALGDERREPRASLRRSAWASGWSGEIGDEARAEDRVGPGREDLDAGSPAASSSAKRNCRPRLLPIQFSCISRTLSGHWSSARQPFEQLLGEVGDLEEPLAELAPLDQRARAPAAAVDHLLVGEHGHVDRVPVDLAFLAIDQARREQVEEQRLLVAVIFGIAGRELAAPVEREAEPLQLRLHRRDVRRRSSRPGWTLLLHRGILGRHAERVPAHRMEHVEALHPLVAREHVAHRVVADMAHMDAPRRIGEHLEDIGLGARRAVVGARKRAALLPDLLPAGVGLERD